MTVDPMSPEEFQGELQVFGGVLADAARRADRRRRVRRAAGTGAAAVLLGLGALVAIPGATRLDPVAEARAALAGPGEILHYRLTLAFQRPPMVGENKVDPEVSVPIMEEVWTTTADPVRWRIRHAATEFACNVSGSSTLAYVSPIEQTYADGLSRAYSPWSNVIIEQRDAQEGKGSKSPFGGLVPRELGEEEPDPTAALRRALGNGTLRDAGTVRVGGRLTRRLTGEVGKREWVQDDAYTFNPRTGKKKFLRPGTKIERRPTRLTYVVDAHTSEPIELKTSRYGLYARAGDPDTKRDRYAWSATIVRFATFERLPASASDQLKLAAPANTKVLRAPTPTERLPAKPTTEERQSAQQALRDEARCRKAAR